jgi:hypothetical protein
MGELTTPASGREDVIPALLSPEIHEALTESARSNGRTVNEEAEHIIKSHLAASGFPVD